MKRSKKAILRSQADKLWKLKIIEDKTICEVCKNELVETAHHFFPKGMFGHLRYDLDNGIAIGRSCHFSHHHKGDPRVHQKIIAERGVKWFNKLKNKSRETPASYQTIKYYKSKIKELQ